MLADFLTITRFAPHEVIEGVKTPTPGPVPPPPPPPPSGG